MSRIDCFAGSRMGTEMGFFHFDMRDLAQSRDCEKPVVFSRFRLRPTELMTNLIKL
jgi:hypothetical protein